MPAKQCVGLDEHEGIAPAREDRGENDQESPFERPEVGFLDLAGGNQELLTKIGVFRKKFRSRTGSVSRPVTTPDGLPRAGASAALTIA